MLSPTDITVVFGMRGSGKSTLSKRLSNAYPRKIVFDRLHEWGVNEGNVIRDFPSFCAIWKELHDVDNFTIILQFDIESVSDQLHDTVNEILRIIYKTGKSGAPFTCLVFEEVHIYAEVHSIVPWFKECILTGRHAGLSIIANSQRPASVNKALVSQAINIFVGVLYEPRDMLYLQEMMGQEAFKAKSIEKYSFIYFSPGKSVQIVK